MLMSQGSDQRHDAAMPRAQRQARGVYYTPEPVVQTIVGLTLRDPATESVLDPACGDGVFLVAAARRIVRQPELTVHEAAARIFGIDCDEIAVAQARANVARALLGENGNARQVRALTRELAPRIIVADALLDPLPPSWPQAFDAIVGNPPYVNIRRLARDPELVQQYRQRFRCARGNFDLYVLFLERAVELLQPGGRCGMIIPNKLATLDYAAAARTMLVEQTRMEMLADLSDQKVFADASVYPHVIVFQKSPPSGRHRVQIMRSTRGDGILANSATVLQSELNRRGVFQWTASQEDGEPTRPLGELCHLHSGTTGFVAQDIAAQLRERGAVGETAFPFITSGNIDRYAVRFGDVRYMQRRFADPMLAADCPRLTPAKRRLFAEPKIVFAGMSQGLEAVWHAGPLALGVQVFAAAEIEIDPFYLLALLNSQWLSQIFRERFSAKRLSGGYFSVNKGQLAQLPIVDPRNLNSHSKAAAVRLAKLGRESSRHGPSPARDGEIDALVAGLYLSRTRAAAA
jgi:tRNA1(Val) A37 N6-methylase TrmN6